MKCRSDSGDGHCAREFDIAAERVCELHLARALALRLEESRASDENAGTPRARCRYVQAVEAVKKLHPSRGILRRRRCHRVDDHWRLLSLEPVYRKCIDRLGYALCRRAFRCHLPMPPGTALCLHTGICLSSSCPRPFTCCPDNPKRLL